MYQEGMPDLYCMHPQHGSRWIEVKLPNMVGSRWTPAQRHWFPLMAKYGMRIYILTNDSEAEYKKLFMEDNWLEYFLLKD